MAIQSRRGYEEDFDPEKMLPGEWAVSLDTKYVRMCFAPGECLRMATYEGFEQDMEEVRRILAECQDIQAAIEQIRNNISDTELLIENYVSEAKKYRDEAKQFRDEAESIVGVDVSNIASDIALNLQTLGYTKKNLLKNTATSRTVNGVTFTVNDNKSVTANGTATANAVLTDTEKKYLGAGTYILNGSPSGSSKSTYILGIGLKYADGSFLEDVLDYGNGVEFTLTQEQVDEGVYGYLFMRVYSGNTVSNLTFYPMIRLASVTDDTYESYVDDVDTRLKSLESGSGGSGGTTGTTNYELLNNKPSINNVELLGNKTTSDLGITAESIGADALGSASEALSDAKDYTDTEIAKIFSDLKTVAFSGSYNDLSNKPTIPEKTSDLINDSGFISSEITLETYEEIMANTESGKSVDALAVKEGFSQVNQNLSEFVKIKINTLTKNLAVGYNTVDLTSIKPSLDDYYFYPICVTHSTTSNVVISAASSSSLRVWNNTNSATSSTVFTVIWVGFNRNLVEVL